jgi:hypothetical protein
MGISCQSSDLVKAAKCLPCVPKQARRWIRTYLLCQVANGGQMAALPAPTGFTFLPSDTTGVTVVATWNAPPAGITATEVWTSTDNITYALAATVAAPGTTASVAYSATVHVLNYCKIRAITATAQSAFTSPIFIPSEVPVWIKAVITNGGVAVAQATCLAMNTFAIALVNAAIDTLMESVNCFVPDNLTAALTPLYKTLGNDPWTNIGPFVGGDLTVNGLLGNGTTKMLDLGFKATAAWANTGNNINAGTSGGVSLYNVTLGTGFVDFGAQSNSASAEFALYIVFQPGADDHCYHDFCNNSTARVSFANAGFMGFTSGNRTSGTQLDIYNANSVTPFSNKATNGNNAVGNAMPSTQNLCCFGYKQIGGANVPNSNRRLSFCGVHLGLSSAQAQSLYNAVQALRTALGGGFV